MVSLPLAAYMRLLRLDKPVGIWLLVLPCWWSVVLASAGNPSPMLLLLFLLGAVVMRGAGCIVNDMADRRIDAQVERTKNRPLASGEVKLGEAAVLLVFLLVIALVIAVLMGAKVVALSALWLPLVVLYPLMKRITWWPQLFLGITFNAGALIGWVAVRGSLDWPALLLYLGAVFWTLGYDTVYAHQDVHDDARIGVKSSARRLGALSRPFVLLCYAVFLACLMQVGSILQLPSFYYAGMGSVGLALALQIRRVRLDDPTSCLQAFRSNQWIGLVIFAILWASFAAFP